MTPTQLQADEGIPPTPQSNSLHYTLPLLQQSGAIKAHPTEPHRSVWPEWKQQGTVHEPPVKHFTTTCFQK